MYECGVELRSHTFEHHSKKLVVGLQYALRHGIALHMLHARLLPENIHYRVVHLYGLRLRCLQCHEVSHLYVASEPHNLVAYGVLESEHNAHADNHHSQPYCHTGCGNAYGRT